jgi:hypothetical protein
MEAAMRARLLVSVAVATLSLCISQGYAQNAGRDETGGEAARPGQSDTATPHQKKAGEAAKKAHERRSEGAQEQNRERAEAKGAKESERQGAAETEKKGEAAKSAKEEERGGKPGMEEKRGHKGKRDSSKHETIPDRGAATQGAKEPEKLDKAGRAESQKEERTGATRSDEDRRGAQNQNEMDRGQRSMERRGEADRDQQQGRDVFGRSGEADKTRGAETTGPQGERQGAFGRTDRDESQRAGRNERGGVRLSERDQTRVRDIIERSGGPRISRNEFNVRIGAVVPPNVQFAPLPPEIVAIAPQYRGYDFVRVEDQIAIIDPGDRLVVAMVGDEGGPPAMYGYDERGGRYEGREGGRYGSAREEGYQGRRERGGRGEAYGYAPRVRLDNRQERALYRGVMQEAKQNLKQVCVRVGDRVPEFVDIEPVPRQIAAETPDVARFDYFVLNDQVVLVDPDSRKVVDIIEEPL